MINQKELKRQLRYDPSTGIFTRLVSRNKSVKVGDVAGGINGDGYIQIRINSKQYKAHRLAWLYMTGEWPKHHIDHDDHIRCNNAWDNLFDVTHQENNKNASKRKDNASGVTGVFWHKVANKWKAQIKIDGKHNPLGLHRDKFEAICARKSAEIKHGFHPNHGMERLR